MKTIIHNNHRIEVNYRIEDGLYAKDQVIYDGKEVSCKWTVVGSTHVFRVNEDSEEVQYDVTIGTRWHGFSWWCEVRREGQIIYTDR